MQALRAFAAVAVIFVHLGLTLQALGLPTFGFGGVDLFFVISGLIMIHTTQRKPVRGTEFLINRVARLVPIYWTLTFGVVVVALAAPQLVPNTDATPIHVLKSLFFVPYARADGRVEPTLFLGWSLNYEMFFYLVFAGGLSLTRRRFGVVLAIWVLAALVLCGLLAPSGSVAWTFYTSPRILEFTLGMLIGLWTPRARETRSQAAVMGCGGLLALALGALLLLPLMAHGANFLFTAGLPGALAVGCAVQLEAWGVRVREGPLFKLGNASYSLYLSHAFVTQAGQKLVGRVHGVIPLVLLMVGLVIVSCGVGWLVYTGLEQPLARAARRLLGARRLRPAAGAGLP